MMKKSGYLDLSDGFCYYAWVHPAILEESKEWAIEQFGEPLHQGKYGEHYWQLDTGHFRWKLLTCSFFFKTEADKNWFILRWG